jgi:hypothetical protein
MMQVDVKNIFNDVPQVIIFLKSCDVGGGGLASIVPFIMLFYGVHSSFYYQHG